MRTLLRILLTGAHNFFRNLWLSIAATAVMVVAISIVLMATVLNVTAQNAIGELSKNLKTSIYLKDDSPVSVRQNLQNDLSSLEYVASVEYVDKQLAQQRFSQIFGDEEGVVAGLEIVGGDSLPESLEVSATDLDRIKEVEAIALSSQYSSVVDEVSLAKTDAEKTIDRARATRTYIVQAGVISSVTFAAVSVLIIFNTIRMAIFTRSEEIRIMKLIGATPGFIRGPFLVEASLYGVIAGIIAFSAVYSMIGSLGSRVATQPEFASSYAYFRDSSTVTVMLLAAIMGGILVGVISSMLAMERYLKLKHW